MKAREKGQILQLLGIEIYFNTQLNEFFYTWKE